MNPRYMPTETDWHPPTLEECAARVKRARQAYEVLAMTNTPSDEVQRMRLSIALEAARSELSSAEACLRDAVIREDRRP